MFIFSETGHICCQNNVAKTNGKTKKIFKKKKKNPLKALENHQGRRWHVLKETISEA